MTSRRSQSHQDALQLVVALAILATTGCGKPDGLERVHVSGKVTLDGQPVEDGTIAFSPLPGTNGPTAGGPIEAGQYTIDDKGPAVGKYKVEIRAMKSTGKEVEAGGPLPPGTMVAEMKQYIPAQYNDETELTVEFTSGENVHDFSLQTKE